MAKSDYRSVESMGNIIKSRMDLMKSWDKKDALALMLPQRVEDNVLYNFRNGVIGGCDGEDVVFHEDETIITETNRITDKFLNTFYAPMNAYFAGPGPDDVEEEMEDAPAADEDSEDEVEETEIDLIAEVKDLVKADELKKAKKVLKANPDHADYKKAKKILKKAKGE